MAILAGIAIATAAAKLGASAYESYKEGSTKASIDYDSMINNEEDLYKEKVSMVDEQSAIQRAGLGIQSSAQNQRLSDIYLSGVEGSGLASSGDITNKRSRGERSIYESYMNSVKGVNASADQSKASLFENFQARKTELEGQKEDAQGWYFGKNAKYALGTLPGLLK